MICPIDIESCGFHGPAVLLQYRVGEKIHLHEIWHEPINKTLDLIDWLCEQEILGFNLAFDWFHVQKMYNCLELLKDEKRSLISLIEEFAEIEPLACDGKCVKPKTALDLMLHARKGPYQSTMDRKDIRVRRIPKILANSLAHELENRVELSDIYFAKRKDKYASKWKIEPIKDKDGIIDPVFCDIVLKFAPSSQLKALVADALGEKTVFFEDVNVPKEYIPAEIGWAPYAKAISSKEKRWTVRKKGTTTAQGISFAWPMVIEKHIAHWRFDEKARKYAANDVKYLDRLYDFFDKPEFGDDDSILACAAGSNRWRGFKVDMEALSELETEFREMSKLAPRAPKQTLAYLSKHLTESEKDLLLDKGTPRVVLETLESLCTPCPECGEVNVWAEEVDSEDSYEQFLAQMDVGIKPLKMFKSNNPNCTTCSGRGFIKHPVAAHAKKCLDARKGAYRLNLAEKFKQAKGRFHAAATIIGTLSSRKSGRTESKGSGKASGSMNSQGIPHDKKIRKCFPLAHSDLVLCGGDAAAYEVSIADAKYNDPKLRQQLLTCYLCQFVWELKDFDETFCPNCGQCDAFCVNCKSSVIATKEGRASCKCAEPAIVKLEPPLRKIHGLFAQELYIGETYDDILTTKGDPVLDKYDQGKRGVFSQFYGGNYRTLMERLGISEEDAIQAETGFKTTYEKIGENEKRIIADHACLRQPGGIGTKVEWINPKEYVVSLTGFPRYFTLEYQIIKALFELSNNIPKAWTQTGMKVVRRDREQDASGAIRSALYAAGFGIQGQVVRAALNHEIQSTGGVVMKMLERRLWDLQPPGVSDWQIMLLNIHDELMVPCKKKLVDVVQSTVQEFVLEKRSLIPLFKMDWSSNMETWAEK